MTTAFASAFAADAPAPVAQWSFDEERGEIGEWQHAAGTFDGSGFIVCPNGEEIGQMDALGRGMADPYVPLALTHCLEGFSNQTYNGVMDNFVILDVSLSPLEKAVMNGGLHRNFSAVNPSDKVVVAKECRPWTYWWWMGSAVDKQNLTQHLETYHKAGVGGVNIIPIYGVKGFEGRFIDYLSPKWMEMLEYTATEAKRLGMRVDITTGTGWPFGGPQVSAKDAATKVILKTYTLNAGAGLSEKLQKDVLQALIAYSDKGKVVDLTEKVDKNGILDWIAPSGKWELYAVSQVGTGQQVKRPAPGAEGNVLDPFSTKSLKNYLKRFDRAFAGYQGDLPRAYYHDSYEYYGANWTDDLFEEFKSRRGYDLRKQLPALFGKGSDDVVARVKSDYRETVSDLHLEYIQCWVKWAHQKGSITRNQTHGAPGNLLDLYAASDIPETEIFGSSRFEIPGLRVDPEGPTPPPDPLVLKFASSAAHVKGKKLVSSESCTWLGEHFKVSLSQVKPEIDQLLVSVSTMCSIMV
jgi:hypothetical protein